MCDGTPCPCNLLDDDRPGPLERLRDWVLRPVTDRLDRIEEHVRAADMPPIHAPGLLDALVERQTKAQVFPTRVHGTVRTTQ